MEGETYQALRPNGEIVGCKSCHQIRRQDSRRHCLELQAFSVDLNEEWIEYIPKAPTFEDGTEEVIPLPPIVDSYSLTTTQSAPFTPLGGTSSSRSSKRKASMVYVIDAQFRNLLTKLDHAQRQWYCYNNTMPFIVRMSKSCIVPQLSSIVKVIFATCMLRWIYMGPC